MGNQDMTDQEWLEIAPNVWKPEKEGDSIAGVLIHKEPENKERNLSARYKIENKDGIFLVWGSAVLTDRMDCVEVGKKVRITFKEKRDIDKGRTLKIYKVEVAQPIETKEEQV